VFFDQSVFLFAATPFVLASLDFLLQDVTSVVASVLEVEQSLPQDLDDPSIIMAGPARLLVQAAGPPKQPPSLAPAAPPGGTDRFGLTS
jgi:hypothetical protein